MKIEFLGAAGMVTGSSYLITGQNGSKILVDLGMFQETEEITNFNFESLSFDVSQLSGVLLTHAHLDHCGRLPLLAKAGYSGKVYMTSATKDITTLSLIDAANTAKEEKHNSALFTIDDVEKIVGNIIPVNYDEEFSVGNYSVMYHDAGHILGSASIELIEKDSKKTVILSGDLGNTPEDLIAPTEFFTNADTVIMESTYGDGPRPVEDVMGIIQSEINIIEKSGGVLLIPAFSIERSQEILHRIGLLKTQNKILNSTPVFLDSPMAIKVMEIFEKYPNLYNKEMSHEKHPFDFEKLTLTSSVEESKSIMEVSNPKLIIARSGMLSGGRILHHLSHYISIPSTRLLLVGYQAVGTLGRKILEGTKQIEIYKHSYSVNATITKISTLSSHADQPKLLNWLSKIKGIKKVFLTHGEDMQRNTLSEEIKKQLSIQNVFLPKKGEEYETD